MSSRRIRHLRRQPHEEAVRLALSEFVGNSGSVDAGRMSHSWGPDDLLVEVHLHEPIAGVVLSLFRRELAERMQALCPRGHDLENWLVVIDCGGTQLATVSRHDKQEELADGTSET